MSNISASRGLATPTFQPASSKGDGNGGNGSGGMYFGQEQGQEQQDFPYTYYPQVDDLGEMPYDVLPNTGRQSAAMQSWITALATQHYQRLLVKLAEESQQQA